MTTIEKNIAIALMLEAVKENWYPANKDNNTTGDYYIFPERTWYPNNKRQHGDYGLRFDSDYNWQFAAIEWVEKQGYSTRISFEPNSKIHSCSIYNHKGEIVCLREGNHFTKKEVIFECLYFFTEDFKRL